MHLLNAANDIYIDEMDFSRFLDTSLLHPPTSKERTFCETLMTKFLININFIDIQIEHINVKQYSSHLKWSYKAKQDKIKERLWQGIAWHGKK